jgi:hypothetical protein
MYGDNDNFNVIVVVAIVIGILIALTIDGTLYKFMEALVG